MDQQEDLHKRRCIGWVLVEKKGLALAASDIQKHCFDFINEILKDDAIKLKATKQLAEIDSIKKQDYLYIIENNGLYKIGYSSNWKKRYQKL